MRRFNANVEKPYQMVTPKTAAAVGPSKTDLPMLRRRMIVIDDSWTPAAPKQAASTGFVENYRLGHRAGARRCYRRHDFG